MSIDLETTRVVRSWLDEGVTRLPERVLDAVIDQLPATPQRHARTWSAPSMNRVITVGIATAAVVAGVFIGTQLLGGPTGSREAVPTATPEPSASMLPRLRMPGMSPNEPAGEYGWEGTSESRPVGPANGMHYVVGDGPTAREATAILFAVGAGCLGVTGDGQTTDVLVAGFSGVFAEPYEPPVSFGGADDGETTRAYALAVEDRTLCVFVTWNSATTPAELRDAFAILETIRAQPIGSDGVRINFTLPSGWDTG